MEFRSLYITAASRDEARKVAQALVESRLAACANIFDGVESIYWWHGKLDRAAEAVVIAKTRAELVEAAIAKVRAIHSYSVPCVVALPILTGNPDYLDWLGAETAPPGGGA